MSFLLTAEVLHGLGLRAGTGPAAFTLQAPGRRRRRCPRAGHGGRSTCALMTPEFPSFVVRAAETAAPLYLRRRGE